MPFDKVLRLLAIRDKQALSLALWKKGSMMENDTRISQSLLLTVPLCGHTCVNGVWIEPGVGIRVNCINLRPKGKSQCISWYFFPAMELRWGLQVKE